VPPVDYLQAIGVALEAFEAEDFEETAAIIQDLHDDIAHFEEFPLAEINYILGLCYQRLNVPGNAEYYLREALSYCPDYEEARKALEELNCRG
jgi:hypothetical protein